MSCIEESKGRVLRAISPWVAGWMVAGVALLPGQASAQTEPKQIIIEPDTALPRVVTLSPLEQRALDNALTAGAVETLPPTRHRSEEGRLEKDISLEPGRCYYVSVAASVAARVNIVYAFGQSADGRPVSDSGNVGNFWSLPGGQGVARFCADRRGPVHVTAGVELVNAEQSVQFGLVVGWRPETPEQIDARHRLSAEHAAAPPD